MVNAVRSRGGSGNRAPGLIDANAIKATAFHYNNSASIIFGGTDEVVIGPSMDSLATFTKSISVSFWFKWDAVAPIQYQGVINANTTAASLNDGWGFYWTSSNTLRFFIGNFNIVAQNATTAALSNLDTQWHHVVGVYDGDQTLDTDTVKIYINGVASATVGTTTIAMNALDKNVEVGRPGNAGSGAAYYAKGNIDEFAVWDIPLSADAVASVYNSGVPFDIASDQGDYTSADDLKLYWRMGEEDTNTAGGIHDASGNGHTGTMTNMEDADIDTTDWAGI